ncbi:MAG: hypothetical protein ACRCX8_02905 [Sarcina sp.]
MNKEIRIVRDSCIIIVKHYSLDSKKGITLQRNHDVKYRLA